MQGKTENRCLFVLDDDQSPDINFGSQINEEHRLQDDFDQMERTPTSSIEQIEDSQNQQAHQDLFASTFCDDLYKRIHSKQQQGKNSQTVLQKLDQLNKRDFQTEISLNTNLYKKKTRKYAAHHIEDQNKHKQPIVGDKFLNKQKTIQLQSNKTIQNNQFINNEENSCKSQSRNCSIKGVVMTQNKVSQMEYLFDKRAIKVSNMRDFVFTPLSPNFKINAVLKRESYGLLNMGSKYTLFIEENNKFIMSIIKKGLGNYIISLSRENINDANKNFLGRIVSNLSGSEFTIYDNGFDPSETRALEFCRKEIGHIIFQNVDKGPRKFSATLASNGIGHFSIEPGKSSLQQKLEKNGKQVYLLKAKQPEYDPVDENYKLDFKGVVERASVKNFIMINNQGKDCMIFGRRSNDSFVMEIKSPLSVLQAAALCVASINHKTIF